MFPWFCCGSIWLTNMWEIVKTNTFIALQLIQDGHCCCKTKGLPDPSHVKLWYVLDAHGFLQPQAQIEAIALSKAECQEKMAQIRNKLSVESVTIRGATGPSANQINGTYKCCKKNSSIKKLFYRCVQSETTSDVITLAYDVSGRWLVGHTLLDCSDNVVLAYSEKSESTDPSDVQRWFTSDSSGCFTVELGMEVTCFHGDSMTDAVESKTWMNQERESLLSPSCKRDQMETVRIETAK